MPTQKYYAIVKDNADLSQDVPIMGWTSLNARPDGSFPSCSVTSGAQAIELSFMTDDAWHTKPLVNPVLRNNSSVMTGSSPTPEPLPLTLQAQRAMQNVQQQASMAAAMGETFGPQMQAYVKQLRAIINGSDTSSTDLPQAPSDMTT